MAREARAPIRLDDPDGRLAELAAKASPQIDQELTLIAREEAVSAARAGSFGVGVPFVDSGAPCASRGF